MSDGIGRYTALTAEDLRVQWALITARRPVPVGGRQGPFLPVETLLCFGLFFVFDPHRYGGANIDRIPPIAVTLAALFRRSAGSILSKMLNLDGSRSNSARDEPALFAALSSHLALYRDLYASILSVARDLAIDETALPDYLGYLRPRADEERDRSDAQGLLLGQHELPARDEAILTAASTAALESWLAPLGQEATDRLAIGRVRLAQHRFAKGVLENWRGTCAFCGFQPRALPPAHGLLRASHIKPWARSEDAERTDVRNGVAACPVHDAAFDQGYLTVLPNRRIVRSALLERSVANGDPGMDLYFGRALRAEIAPDAAARLPGPAYLSYHHDHIFHKER